MKNNIFHIRKKAAAYLLCCAVMLALLGGVSSVYADPYGLPVTLPNDDSTEDKGEDPYDTTEDNGRDSSDSTEAPYGTTEDRTWHISNTDDPLDSSDSTEDRQQLQKQYQNEQEQSDYYRDMVEDLTMEIAALNLQIMEEAAKLEESKAALSEIDDRIYDSEQTLEDINRRLEQDQELNNETVVLMYLTRLEADNLSGLLAHESIYYLLSREEYMHGLEDYIYERLDDQQELLQEAEDQNGYLQELLSERKEEAEEYEAQLKIMEARVERLTGLMQEAKQKAEDSERFAATIKQKLLDMEEREKEQLSKQTYQAAYSDVTYTGNGTTFYYESAYSYTDAQLTLLAGIIEAEAGSSSYPGMIAVGSVVMNRVNSPQFSNTIEGVIYAPSQFEPASTGRLAMILAKGPEEACVNAAREVLDGKRNVPNYYFKAAWYAEAHGIQGVNIGGNVFH